MHLIFFFSISILLSQVLIIAFPSIGAPPVQEVMLSNRNLQLLSETSLDGGKGQDIFSCNDILNWGTDHVDAERVWGGVEDAVDTLPFPKLTGRGVNVAIIDSGIDYNHSDLAPNYAGGYDFVVDDSEWFPETGDYDGPKDYRGHGTLVAGIIAASDDGNGIVGVAPDATIYALRVSDAQGIYSLDKVAPAIEWCIDTHYDEDPSNDINVINMSFGGTLGDEYDEIEAAIDMAYLTGIVLVAATGNEFASSLIYPARFWNVIAVGSISEDHQRAPSSNYGIGMELVAPGVDIYSTLPTFHVTYNNEPYNLAQNYDFASGTSYAAPFVARICALFFEYNPNYTPAEIRVKLMNTAEDLGDSGWDEEYGYGMVCGWFLYDLDNDGLLNDQEKYDYGSNPLIVDTDGDLLSDGVEVNTHGTNPLSVDTDGDGYTDYYEIYPPPLYDPSDPNDYNSIPTVGGGLFP